MKWILIIVGILILLIGIVVLIGYLLPEKHKVSISQTFDRSPEEIWNSVSNFKKYKDWRSDLKEVSEISANSWVETNNRNEKLTLKIIEAKKPRKMITKIMDEKLPYGGTWTFEINSAENGTVLTIIEDGEIYNAVFRFFAHFVFGYEGTIRQYLADLTKALEK